MSIFGGKIVKIKGFNLYSYGSLLQEEEEWLDKQPARKAIEGIRAAKFISDIAKSCDSNPQKVITALEGMKANNLDSPEVQAIFERFDEIPVIMETMSGGDDSQREQVTMFINSRVDVNWLESVAEELSSELRVPTDRIYPVWTNEATRRLPKPVMVGIVEFAGNEMKAGLENSGLPTEESEVEPVPTVKDIASATSTKKLGK
jgi:hypothetical protein